jgi:peptide/nickel transport system substrate-binding protein
MVGEPPSLDPMQATTDLVGTIMQHVYEPLYTFDAKWNVVPMLAEGMPRFSADGKVVTITLRKGVKLHSGRALDAEDVVVSLKRWIKEAPRGKAVGKEIVELKSPAQRHHGGADAAQVGLTRRCSRSWLCPAAWPPSWPRRPCRFRCATS